MGVFRSLKNDDEKKTAAAGEATVTEDAAAADKKKSAKASAKQHYLTGKRDPGNRKSQFHRNASSGEAEKP